MSSDGPIGTASDFTSGNVKASLADRQNNSVTEGTRMAGGNDSVTIRSGTANES